MNKREFEDRWEGHLRALGMAIARVSRHVEGGPGEGPVLTDLRFNLEADNRTSVLIVVKARGPAGGLIGFVGGPDLGTAVLSLAKKLSRGALKWREDLPWEERRGAPGG